MSFSVGSVSGFTTSSNIAVSLVRQGPDKFVFNLNFPDNFKANGSHKTLIENAVGKQFVYSHSFDRNGAYCTSYPEKVCFIFDLARRNNYINDEDRKKLDHVMRAAGVHFSSISQPQHAPVPSPVPSARPVPLSDEEEILQQALKASLEEHKRQEESRQQQDREELQAALRQIAELEAKAKEEEELLQSIEFSKALEQSLISDAPAAAPVDFEEDAEFLLAIQLSKQQEHEKQEELAPVVQPAPLEEEDEEFLLAIQLSKLQPEEKPIESEVPGEEQKVFEQPVIPAPIKYSVEPVPIEILFQNEPKDLEEKKAEEQNVSPPAKELEPEPAPEKKIDLPQLSAAMKRGSPPPPPPPSPRVGGAKKTIRAPKPDALSHAASAPTLKKPSNRGAEDFIAELKAKTDSRAMFKFVPVKKKVENHRVNELEQSLKAMKIAPEAIDDLALNDSERDEDEWDAEGESPSPVYGEHEVKPFVTLQPAVVSADKPLPEASQAPAPLEAPASNVAANAEQEDLGSLLSTSLLNHRRQVEGDESNDSDEEFWG